MARRRPPPTLDVRTLRAEHQVPPGRQVVLPRGVLFRAFRTELLERFTRAQAPKGKDGA